MDKSIQLEEQETVISFSPTRVSKTAEVYTCMPDWIKRIRGLAKSRPDCVRIERDLGDALFAEVDKSCIKLSPKRKMTEAQRVAASERLAKGREKIHGAK